MPPSSASTASASASAGSARAVGSPPRSHSSPATRGELPVAFQLLDCPMLDDRQRTAVEPLDGLAVWSRESNTFGWQSYLGDLYGTRRRARTRPHPPGPTRPRRPAAGVRVVGAVDGFRDEDIDYALRLNQAGVPTELHVYPGLPHGHALFPGVPAVAQWQRDLEDWLGRQFHRDEPR